MSPVVIQKQLKFDIPMAGEMTLDEWKRQGEAVYYHFNHPTEWGDEQGNLWQLEEMASSHLSNVRGYLLKYAEIFFTWYSYGEAVMLDRHERAFGIPDDFNIPSVLDDWQHGQEREWMLTTNIVKRIDEILDTRHRGVSFGEVVG